MKNNMQPKTAATNEIRSCRMRKMKKWNDFFFIRNAELSTKTTAPIEEKMSLNFIYILKTICCCHCCEWCVDTIMLMVYWVNMEMSVWNSHMPQSHSHTLSIRLIYQLIDKFLLLVASFRLLVFLVRSKRNHTWLERWLKIKYQR